MWRAIKTYFLLPEMRLFWLFFVLALVIIVINWLYLPSFWRLISLVILTTIGIIIFYGSLRTARANLSVKSKNHLLDSVIGNLSDGVIAYDQSFKILIFNRAAEQIFDIKSQEIVGDYITLDRAREPKFKLLAQAVFFSLAPVVVMRSSPGVYPQIVDLSFEEPVRELRALTDRLFDESGNILGFVKVIKDRTREMELLRRKSEFVSIVAHQLRTPLTAINWVFDGLNEDQSLSAETKALVQSGSGAGKKLLSITEDLLSVAKIEEGRFGYQFEDINIVSFLDDVLGQASIIAEQRNVKLYYDHGRESSIMVSVDPQKLGIAVSNLLDNAVKYNVPGGEVAFKLERLIDRPFIRISVKDTGIGISPEDMKKLFSKFYRGENATKVFTEGTGLGLFIAKNIVKRHGGEIWAESVLNRGTAFYFTLPTDPKLIPAKEIAYGEE